MAPFVYFLFHTKEAVTKVVMRMLMIHCSVYEVGLDVRDSTGYPLSFHMNGILAVCHDNTYQVSTKTITPMFFILYIQQ